ncbi:MAG: beta-N-acetylglucosaminidase domain-containing protein [Bacteroidaceae bacterium]|nr:beta-N-acetylglucosaminidase domain-containing protein [Bacteroidaceae bacterium]
MHLTTRLIGYIAVVIGILIATTSTAQRVNISPLPQHAEWSGKKAFDNNVTYSLKGDKNADANAVELFRKNFNTGKKGIKVIIGERGDKAVEKYTNLIPQKAEGYYLEVTEKTVVIAGNDDRGTFYGVQTFIQIASQPHVMEVSISDYPSISERGLVEGYYGNPYSEKDRFNLFEFFGRQKMNVYIYGPKDDVYHKQLWREPYPAELGEKISEYASAARANKVDFVWAIHPGVDIKWNRADSLNIVNKLKLMYDLGIRSFAVFFDDIWGEGTRADKQAGLMNYIVEELNKSYDDVNPLIICPTQYNKGWSSGDYLNTLGTKMNKSVRIMWTGNSVVDMIELDDMQWINEQIKRKAYIWLNYPVTDYCINRLLMGPTWGNGLDIANTLGGFTSNPMEYAMASKLSLYSIGDYCWNMENYDAKSSWENAITYLMPKNRDTFHFFCENNVDLGSTVHGLRRTEESPRFVEAKKNFDKHLANRDTTTAVKVMREEMQLFTSTAKTLMTCDEATELTSEIMPWLKCMELTGLRGERIMDMYIALTQNNPQLFVESYMVHQELFEEQEKLRSRDFEGTLKWAKPEVAMVHMTPFLKSSLASLITLYKSRYNYRNEIFPAQEVENGTYFIMCDNKYLTNETPNVARSKPAFVEERDDIRPQRQEWHISLDPLSGRYKIINAEDSRYLNEHGRFSAGESNPYDATWHTYNIVRLANGKYSIQNDGNAGNKIWSVDGKHIKQSDSNTLEPEHFIFDLIPISGNGSINEFEDGAIYYIKVGGKYLTNTNIGGIGYTPQFQESLTPDEKHEWVISKDIDGKGFYKIVSNADGRYINEYADFGTNPYAPDWNTYLILVKDNKYSIQTTQKSGINFWNINTNRLSQDNSLSRQQSYIIEIIKK